VRPPPVSLKNLVHNPVQKSFFFTSKGKATKALSLCGRAKPSWPILPYLKCHQFFPVVPSWYCYYMSISMRLREFLPVLCVPKKLALKLASHIAILENDKRHRFRHKTRAQSSERSKASKKAGEEVGLSGTDALLLPSEGHVRSILGMNTEVVPDMLRMSATLQVPPDDNAQDGRSLLEESRSPPPV